MIFFTAGGTFSIWRCILGRPERARYAGNNSDIYQCLLPTYYIYTKNTEVELYRKISRQEGIAYGILHLAC